MPQPYLYAQPADTNLATRFYTQVAVASPRWVIGAIESVAVSSGPFSQVREIENSLRFNRLAGVWHRDTDIISSPTKKKSHRAYRQILAMGMVAVPFILGDLRDRGGDWYEALTDITGESPVPQDAQGDVRRMNEAWFRWGRERGFLA